MTARPALTMLVPMTSVPVGTDAALPESPLPQYGPMLEHPRPQLTRPGWEDLGGTWAFAFDDAAVGISEHWQQRDDVFDRAIQVPFPFESPASGIDDTGFHPVVWYRRTFRRNRRTPGRRLLLHFGAVDYRAHVWVNGVAVAYHEGGHTPFTADITSALDDSGARSSSSVPRTAPRDLRQPRGKQDWQERAARHLVRPHDAGSGSRSGWRTCPRRGSASLRWTPDVDQRGLDLTVRLRTDRPTTGRCACGVVLRQGGRLLADDTYAVGHVESSAGSR